MVRLRILLAAVLTTGLAACAAGPSSAPSSGPSTAPGGAAGASSLYLCRGTGIANAPASDASGRIADYSPEMRIAGAWLYRAPVEACVSSGYGPRRGGAGSFHHGVDLYTGSPRPIVASGDGVVEFVGMQRGYGRVIIIRHNRDVTTRYAHLSSFARGLKEGEHVRRGSVIGATGDSGNATAVHLHYEIRVSGRAVNPITAGG